MSDTPFPLLKRADIEALPERKHVHQFNENGVRMTRSLGDILGLTTLGLHLVRLEPGRDSTQFHTHHRDEEFVYILEGRGIAEIGDTTTEVSAGDVMAFGQQSLPHAMHNPFDEDLLYLMGGTRPDFDICDYPHLNRRMFRVDGVKTFTDMDNLTDVAQPDRGANEPGR